ncbi:AraC family transcriptional regulator [Chitinophaga parva]|nr:AraC family transcriptional regulator [Chitinophaga parva]
MATPLILEDAAGMVFLKAKGVPYALYRQQYESSRRSVFLAQHKFIFIIRGEKHLHLPDQDIIVRGNDVLLLKRGQYAMSDCIPDDTYYEALIIFFDDNFLQKFFRQYGAEHAHLQAPPSDHHVVLFTQNPLLHSFREQYKQYFETVLENPEPLLQLKLQELFLLLLAGPQKEAVWSYVKSVVQQQPADIEYIVRHHLLQPLTIEELAQLSGRSLASFKRDFQQRYQCPPKKWINEQRLAHAHMLLNNSNKNVSEIALECGFENVPHFIRIFKTHYGCTPNAVRTKKAIM